MMKTGFAIPEPYIWDESFRVFYDTLDEQHKNLFHVIFSLAKSPDDPIVLKHLVKTIDEHFDHEEGLLRKANYADYDVHHQEHLNFQKALKKVRTPVSDEQITWAKDWLVNHIKGTDFQYKGKL
ncbi:hypothetical protein HELRODRAFT_185740 [Helobdella robusta]|uniref:Hemerythrin-like domain-containing protein n=1 Tax=Helobdella robusta TaxID=6412 RepID=T1FN80_HELRO|nr:hypothetical protein HELRODRAFT_185740 [Helobdella robusta]ESO00872.1 hypothetical protein HELRODRAFT_185740 [Helobdella robusta]